ncbi:hypothetical protein PIB30_034222 [Stylosanthes scabra]|uniref:Uncharacterized protein n=1 Tax=Stylosanthes scabra TaxID=79078 RepID=A0ABU6TCG0_9FABA|nr:hypothetical protein [Stylosanthes scabra]
MGFSSIKAIPNWDIDRRLFRALARAFNPMTSKLELVLGEIDVTTEKIGAALGLPSVGKSFPEEWTSEQEGLIAPFKSVNRTRLKEILASKIGIVTLLVEQGVISAKFSRKSNKKERAKEGATVENKSRFVSTYSRKKRLTKELHENEENDEKKKSKKEGEVTKEKKYNESPLSTKSTKKSDAKKDKERNMIKTR